MTSTPGVDFRFAGRMVHQATRHLQLPRQACQAARASVQFRLVVDHALT